MSVQMGSHTTPSLTIEEFQCGHMKPLSYSPEDISAAIVNHLQRSKDNLTDIQLKGLAEIQYNVGGGSPEPENLDELQRWFNILNAIVFNGLLPRDSQIEIFPQSRGENESFWGYCLTYCRSYVPGAEVNPKFRIEKVKIDMGIRSLAMKYYERRSYTRRAKLYRNYLLHAMLHALFETYTCRCKNGCGDRLSESHSRYGGHDVSWLAAAYAIEQADAMIIEDKNEKAQNTSMLLGIYLGRDRVVARSWDIIPPAIELRRLGLDIVEIRRELEKWRDINADLYNTQRQRRQLMELNRCKTAMWIVDMEDTNYGRWNSAVALTRI